MSGTGGPPPDTNGVSPPPDTHQPQPQPSDDKFVEELWDPGAKRKKAWIVAKLTGGTVREELAEVLQKLVIYLPYSRYSPEILKNATKLISLSFKLSGFCDSDIAITTLKKSSFVSELCYKGIFLAEAQSEHSMEDAEYRACIVLLKHLAETVPTLKMKDEYWSLDAWKNTLVHTPEESSLCRIQSFQQIPDFSTAQSLISSIPEDSDQEIIFTDMLDNKEVTSQELREGFKNLSSIFDWRVIENTEIEQKSEYDYPGAQYNVVGVSRSRLSSYWTEKLNASDSADDPSCLIAHCRYQLYPPNDPDGIKYLKELCIFAVKELHKTVKNDSHSLIKEEPCNLPIKKTQEEIISDIARARELAYQAREKMYDAVKDLLLKGGAIHRIDILKLESVKTRRRIGLRFLRELQEGLLKLPDKKKRHIIWVFTRCGISEIVQNACMMLRQLDYSQAIRPGDTAWNRKRNYGHCFSQEAIGSGVVGMVIPQKHKPFRTIGDGQLCPPLYNYVREQLLDGYPFKGIREWTEQPLEIRRWMVGQYFFELKAGLLPLESKKNIMSVLKKCGFPDLVQTASREINRPLKAKSHRNDSDDYGPCFLAHEPYPGPYEPPLPMPKPPPGPLTEEERNMVAYHNVKEMLLKGHKLRAVDWFHSATVEFKNCIVKQFIDEHAKGLLPRMTKRQLREAFVGYDHLKAVRKAQQIGFFPYKKQSW